MIKNEFHRNFKTFSNGWDFVDTLWILVYMDEYILYCSCILCGRTNLILFYVYCIQAPGEYQIHQPTYLNTDIEENFYNRKWKMMTRICLYISMHTVYRSNLEFWSYYKNVIYDTASYYVIHVSVLLPITILKMRKKNKLYHSSSLVSAIDNFSVR